MARGGIITLVTIFVLNINARHAGGDLDLDRVRQSVVFGSKQLQKKWDHAGDFGVFGNYNPDEQAQEYEDALQRFVRTAPEVILGEYRGKPVIFFYDPKTRTTVITDRDGNYISGWQLSRDQAEHLKEEGKLGGG